MAKTFVSKWVLSGRTGQVEPELDLIRSEYPPTVASGMAAFTSAGMSTSILAVPSACRFHLQRLIITNEADETNKLLLYDGPGATVTFAPILVAGSTTNFIDMGPGMVFASGVHGSNLTSGLTVRVGGLLRMSGPE